MWQDQIYALRRSLLLQCAEWIGVGETGGWENNLQSIAQRNRSICVFVSFKMPFVNNPLIVKFCSFPFSSSYLWVCSNPTKMSPGIVWGPLGGGTQQGHCLASVALCPRISILCPETFLTKKQTAVVPQRLPSWTLTICPHLGEAGRKQDWPSSLLW